MRIKEVDDAIKYYTKCNDKDLENYEEFSYESKENIRLMTLLLNYISELEEKVNAIDTQFIHKDKVYEIVEEINKQVDVYNDAVDKFNKLLKGE